MSFVSKVIPRALIPVLAVTAALATPAVASAHARLVSSEPAADSSLAAAPTEVTATFNEELEPAFAAMTVVGPDQGQWAAGPPEVSDTEMSMPVKPLGLAGTYTVNFRVTSADGHVVEGSWAFELTTPAAPSQAEGPVVTTSAAAAPATTSAVAAPVASDDKASDSRGLPAWPFLIAAPVVVLGAVLAFWVFGRWRAQRR
jgi:methionine-rich copper-binding protein CopC